MPDSTIDRSCGPSECQIEWLASERIEVDDDPVAFTKFATDAGWGDGLPLIPPREDRVREYVAASGRFPDELIAELPPRRGRCTVEKIAVNAVMAGAPKESMPLLIASIDAMADPDFNLFALNTTTCCVVPGMFVNGPARRELDIPYGAGCFGGEAGPGPAIGRATRLIMRNVAGQKVGSSSNSVFGQSGRVTGIVVGEWAERSPWAPLAERRGACAGTNAVTFHGAEVAVAIAPPWADLIAKAVPDIADVQRLLWEHAALPVTTWPEAHRRVYERGNKIDERGMVPLVQTPDHLIVLVCGGLGNLHALAMHSFGPTRSVTRRF